LIPVFATKNPIQIFWLLHPVVSPALFWPETGEFNFFNYLRFPGGGNHLIVFFSVSCDRSTKFSVSKYRFHFWKKTWVNFTLQLGSSEGHTCVLTVCHSSQYLMILETEDGLPSVTFSTPHLLMNWLLRITYAKKLHKFYFIVF